MRVASRLLCLLVPLMMLGCPGQRVTPPPQAAPPAMAEAPVEEEVEVRASKSGLGFRLTEIDKDPGAKNKLAKTVPLSDADADKLFARLPPLEAAPGDELGFSLRDKSRPPPRTGKTVSDTFPPPVARPAPQVAESGPLRVLRHLPDGPVDLAPQLSVTFSQPMVPVTSHGDLGDKPPPVKLSPTPPGKWRWVGTQTLLFEPEGRFPMATKYEVEIPAGTRSATGGELGSAERFSFETPPLKLVEGYPHGGSIGLEPLIVMRFDQAVDERELLAKLKVRAGNSQIMLRPATDDEVEADAHARRARASAEKGRLVIARAPRKLPTDTAVSVVIPEGTPSAEGPRRTEAEQSFSFRTYGPLRASRIHCSWQQPCAPLTPWRVDLTNPIDEQRFDRSMVRVEPEVDDLKVVAQGSSITLSGRTRGRTKYKVTLSPGITDRFGQTLGAEAELSQQVDSAEPMLFPEERRMAVLDPEGAPSLPVFSINRPQLKIRLYQVEPQHWDAYQKFRSEWDYEGKRHEPPGRLVYSRVVPVRKAPDELVETPVDLSPALRDGTGQVIAIVEPTTPPPRGQVGESLRTWLQVTKLGVESFTDAERTVAWVTSLASGAPVAGAEVSFLGGARPQATGQDGLAAVEAASPSLILVARRGGDLAMLPGGSRNLFSVVRESDQLQWLVFDDRKTYKPGEEVHVKGYVRVRLGGKGQDIGALRGAEGKEIEWKLTDSRGVELGKGSGVRLGPSGSFDMALKLPKTPNLGSAQLHLKLPQAGVWGEEHTHSLEIQEFRRPEFEVSASSSEGPHRVGGHATLSVAARYYAGGGLADAPVDWRVTSSTARFSPPGRPGFVFGESPGYWWSRRHGRGEKKQKDRTETMSSHTSASGEHRLRVDFDALEPSFPMSLVAEATVTDVNRQGWSARTTLLVHPADAYVGLRPRRSFVRAGEAYKLDAIVVDEQGKARAGRKFTIRSARLDEEQVAGEITEVEKDIETCELSSTDEPVECSLSPRTAGRYRLMATLVDAHGRKSQTEHYFWAFGEGMTPERGLDRSAVQIVADKDEYRPGETAEILLFAPFAPSEGVVTLRRQGITHLARFRMNDRVGSVKVPVGEGVFPSVNVAVDLVGSAPREAPSGQVDPRLPPRPAYASGSSVLSVPPTERTLKVKAHPRDEALEPGGSTTVDLEVRDSRGQAAAGAEVALVVVDEAILALGSYELPDPVAAFYGPRDPGVQTGDLRADVLLGKVEGRVQARAGKEGAKRSKDGIGLGSVGTMGHGAGGGGYGRGFGKAYAPGDPLAMARAAPAPTATASMGIMAPEEKAGGEGSASEQANKKVTVRADFNPLAAFVPSAMTDAEGKASVPVKLPDNLTRYRVMAVASSGETRFGKGDAELVARLPLMVRPSAPRFLNFGDRFELPVVIQNQTSSPMEVDLVARATNAQLTEGKGRRFSVPPNDRVEVRLPSAAQRAGTARFQIGAASGRFSDASTFELPVWTPATTEAFATYGQIDEGAIAQPVKMPQGVVKEFGGLELTTSSTAVSALTDAVLYLVRYPFECNEQIASRVLAIASLRDVLSAFGAPGLPDRSVLLESVSLDVKKLRGRQHWSGGFSFWGADREVWPYLSIHVMHALSRARDKGFAVPEDMLTRGRSYLRSIEQHIPHYYGEEARRAIVAYALYTRKRLGEADPERARKLIAEAGGVEKMPLEGLGFVLSVLSGDERSKGEVEKIRLHLANRVSETAGAAHFVTSYGEQGHLLLHSDRRVDGILLEALIGDEPKSDLIPKLVTGLLGHRKAGRWYNTQENAFVLLALDRYFNTYEKTTPDFVARAWLGESFAGEHAFKGRTTERHEIDVPMRLLAEAGDSPSLVLQKDGPGRLYFRIGMQYAPADLRPPPAEHGFTVSRAYESVDAPEDVRRDQDGTWRVRSGAKVRVRVSMVAPARRYHVALVDPLPAGFEPMNPALAVTGSIPPDPSKPPSPTTWWSRTWYEHQNMRDERVEAFTSLLWDGVYDYTYVARATTPGTFVVPPPKAEEMYSPETFGRGAGDRVIVE